jgi:hypothetical protein
MGGWLVAGRPNLNKIRSSIMDYEELEAMVDYMAIDNVEKEKKITALEADNARLREDNRERAALEIDATAVIFELRAYLISIRKAYNQRCEYIEELESRLALLEWRSVKDTVANLLCYLVDRYENQPLSEIKLQEIGTEFLRDKHYNKPIPAQPDSKTIYGPPTCPDCNEITPLPGLHKCKARLEPASGEGVGK